MSAGGRPQHFGWFLARGHDADAEDLFGRAVALAM